MSQRSARSPLTEVPHGAVRGWQVSILCSSSCYDTGYRMHAYQSLAARALQRVVRGFSERHAIVLRAAAQSTKLLDFLLDNGASTPGRVEKHVLTFCVCVRSSTTKAHALPRARLHSIPSSAIPASGGVDRHNGAHSATMQLLWAAQQYWNDAQSSAEAVCEAAEMHKSLGLERDERARLSVFRPSLKKHVGQGEGGAGGRGVGWKDAGAVDQEQSLWGPARSSRSMHTSAHLLIRRPLRWRHGTTTGCFHWTSQRYVDTQSCCNGCRRRNRECCSKACWDGVVERWAIET